jgi:hypothetical protein
MFQVASRIDESLRFARSGASDARIVTSRSAQRVRIVASPIRRTPVYMFDMASPPTCRGARYSAHRVQHHPPSQPVVPVRTGR